MDIGAFLLFAGVYFVAVASPGPGLAAVVARGLGQGVAAGPAFIAGFVAGELIWFSVAATGLAVLAQTFETLFTAIKYAGCAYLVYMAYKIWTAPVQTAEVTAASRVRAWPSFLGSLSLALGNPKVIVFFLSVLPLVVDLEAVTPVIFAEMAVAIALILAGVNTTVLLLAERARRLFTSQKALRRINRGTAVVMGGVAGVIVARG